MTFKQGPSRGLGTRWIALVGLVGFVVVALATIIDVLLRWLFGMPVDGVAEISRLIVAVSIASFFPLALADRHHISIEFLGAALGARARLWLDLLAHIVTLIFFIALGWQFVLYTVEITESGEATWVLAWKAGPWWTVATVFMLACIPVQALVLFYHVKLMLSGGKGLSNPPTDVKADG